MRTPPAPARRSLALLLSLGLAACAGEPDSGPESTAAEPEVPPATSPAPSPADSPARGGALRFAAPEGWIEEEPSSSMRAAQYRLPHEAGDAELVVFRFPGGGTVEANFQRWAGQFEQPDGGDSMEVAVFSEREVAGMPVHEMDVSGRYTPASFGMGSTEPVEDARLLGAVIESPYGTYFVKATGPAEALARWESSYRAFVSGLRP